MASAKDLLRMLDDPSFGQAKQADTARRLLEQLEASGDIRPAEQETLDELRAAQPQTDRAIGQTGAAYRGALQGATFQQADELAGLMGGDTEVARARNLQAELEFPGTYNRAKTGGAVLSGAGTALATGPLATGKTLWGTMFRGAGLGGAEGFLWGSGGAEGADKLSEGGRYAVGGLAIGGAAPAVTAGLAGAGRAAKDVGLRVAGRGNTTRAQRSVVDALNKSGRSLDDVSADVVAARAAGQPEYRLMDALGRPGARKVSGIVRRGDDGAEEIAAFLEQRAIDAPDRMLGYVDEAFNPQPRTNQTAETVTQGLKAARKKTGDAAYAAARANAGPVDVRGALSVIDDRIGGMQGSNITGDGIDAKLARFRSRLAADPAPEGELSRELSDFDRVLGVKQDVQDAIGAAVRAGRNNEARELGKLVNELDSALEASSDAYRFANDNYRAASGVIDAVPEGQTAARRGRAEDNLRRFGGMTPDQQTAYRAGYGDTLSQRIEGKMAEAPNVSREMASTKRARETAAIANNPREFADRVAREGQMFETFDRALRGSRTADNIADQADVGAIADALRAGTDATRGNVGGVISQGTDLVARGAGALVGPNAPTRRIISQLLMSDDPQKALAAAVRSGEVSQQTRRIVEAILRRGAMAEAE